MKVQLFATMAFALLAGCGPWSSSTCVGRQCGRNWTGGGGLPPSQYESYVIDAGAAIELPQATLGNTTHDPRATASTLGSTLLPSGRGTSARRVTPPCKN